MRHRISGKQLSRNTSHRKALRRNMAIALFQHGAIRTTEVKAKELKSFVEKIITMARKGTLHARRIISAELGNRGGVRGEMFRVENGRDEVMEEKGILQKLFDDIAPRYANRPGGYTRIIRLAERRIGDAGKQVVLQLVEDSSEKSGGEAATGGTRRRRAAKRSAAVAPATPAPEVTGTTSNVEPATEDKIAE
jgi:large subunit ribosomal protein L17